MEWSTVFLGAAVVVSVLAAIVAIAARSDSKRSAAAAEASARASETVASLEEDRRKDELAKRGAARLIAKLELRQKHTRVQPCLVISNEGEAEARNISFDPTIFGQGKVIGVANLPIPTMAPGGEFDFPLVLAWAGGETYQLILQWEDDSAPGRKQAYTLSAPVGY